MAPMSTPPPKRTPSSPPKNSAPPPPSKSIQSSVSRSVKEERSGDVAPSGLPLEERSGDVASSGCSVEARGFPVEGRSGDVASSLASRAGGTGALAGEGVGIPSRFARWQEARARFGTRADRLAAFFTRMDPLADALADQLASGPKERAEGWRLFELALEHGGNSLPAHAPACLRDFFAQVESPPAWLDEAQLFDAGKPLLRAGQLGGIVLGVRSLVLGYATPGGNKPLALSGQLVERAPRRLSETSRFVYEVCKPGGTLRHAPGFKITLRVRLMHATVRRLVRASDRWRGDLWGEPINQHDMAATTLLFSRVLLEGLRQLGDRISLEEGERYMQLWRYVGWLSGVEEQLLPVTESEAERLGEFLTFAEGPPDDDARALTRALFEVANQSETGHGPWANQLQHYTVRAICRFLLGDTLADALGVEPTPGGAAAVAAVRRITRAAALLREHSPALEARAIQAGHLYWENASTMHIPRGATTFTPPSKLRDLHAHA